MSVMSEQEIAVIKDLTSAIKMLAEALADDDGNVVQALRDLNAGQCLRVAPALERVASEIAQAAAAPRSIDCGTF